MFKIFRDLDFYILALFVAYIVYYAQDHANAVLNSFGLATSSNSLLGKLITISFFILVLIKVKISPYKLPSYIKIFFIIWIGITTLSNFLNLNNASIAFNTSFQQMLWPVVFMYFYHGSKGASLNGNMLKVFILLLFILLSFIIYSETVYLRTFGQYTQQIQINEIYFMLLLFPWILMLNESKFWNIIKLSLMLLSIWFVFFSLKRTAMMGLGLAVVGYLFGMYRQRKIKFSTILFLLFVGYVGYFLFDIVNDEFGGRIIERILNIKTDKGSGRLDIYSDAFYAMGNWKLPEYMFGEGRGSISKYTGGYSAHNEFLEVVFSWGFIALLAYSYLIVKLFLTFNSNKDYKNIPVVYSSFGVYVAMCITSHLVIYPYLFNLLVALWGFHLAKIDKTR